MAAELAAKHYNDIYSFCCSRLMNTDDASDVTQNVFLLFQQKSHTLENTNIRSWLYSVANKKIYAEYRNRVKESKIVSLNEGVADEQNEALYEFDDYCYVDDDVIDRAKEKILSKLTSEERRLFLEIYEKRSKYSEVAEKLSISEKTVNVRSYRLRKKIKDMVEIAFMLFIYTFVKLK